MKINELDTLKCRFDGCGDPAIFLVEFEKGCVCYPDTLQALCQQHWQTAEPLGPCRVVCEIYERVKKDE